MASIVFIIFLHSQKKKELTIIFYYSRVCHDYLTTHVEAKLFFTKEEPIMDKNMQLFEQNNNSPKVKCQKCRRYIGMCMYIYTQTYARVLCVSLFEEKKSQKKKTDKKKCVHPLCR